MQIEFRVQVCNGNVIKEHFGDVAIHGTKAFCEDVKKMIEEKYGSRNVE